jgi:hypothetical protein
MPYFLAISTCSGYRVRGFVSLLRSSFPTSAAFWFLYPCSWLPLYQATVNKRIIVVHVSLSLTWGFSHAFNAHENHYYLRGCLWFSSLSLMFPHGRQNNITFFLHSAISNPLHSNYMQLISILQAIHYSILLFLTIHSRIERDKASVDQLIRGYYNVANMVRST